MVQYILCVTEGVQGSPLAVEPRPEERHLLLLAGELGRVQDVLDGEGEPAGGVVVRLGDRRRTRGIQLSPEPLVLGDHGVVV